MVIRLAKRIAVSVLFEYHVAAFLRDGASETKGTRLPARDAVTMVGMLTRAVAICRSDSRRMLLTLFNRKPATSSLLEQ